MRILMIVAATLILGSACMPIHLSAACRERVSRCLESCPGRDDSTYNRTRENGLPTVDTRTECERQCHNLCIDGGSSPTMVSDPDSVLPPQTKACGAPARQHS